MTGLRKKCTFLYMINVFIPEHIWNFYFLNITFLKPPFQKCIGPGRAQYLPREKAGTPSPEITSIMATKHPHNPADLQQEVTHWSSSLVLKAAPDCESGSPAGLGGSKIESLKDPPVSLMPSSTLFKVVSNREIGWSHGQNMAHTYPSQKPFLELHFPKSGALPLWYSAHSACAL